MYAVLPWHCQIQISIGINSVVVNGRAGCLGSLDTSNLSASYTSRVAENAKGLSFTMWLQVENSKFIDLSKTSISNLRHCWSFYLFSVLPNWVHIFKKI